MHLKNNNPHALFLKKVGSRRPPYLPEAQLKPPGAQLAELDFPLEELLKEERSLSGLSALHRGQHISLLSAFIL
jgi:hypothetical protein